MEVISFLSTNIDPQSSIFDESRRFLCFKLSANSLIVWSSSSEGLYSAGEKRRVSDSNCDRSKIEESVTSNLLPEMLMNSIMSRISSSMVISFIKDEKPRMPLRGVRSSCPMLSQRDDFSLADSSAFSFSSINSLLILNISSAFSASRIKTCS